MGQVTLSRVLLDLDPMTTGSERRPAREHRLPPVIAVVVAIAAYGLLPETLLFAPRFVIPAIAAALLVGLLITGTRSQGRRTRLSRVFSGALAGVVITANLVALGILVRSLVDPATSGTALLLGAVQVWLTNVIGFSLLYWEIDRGGPVARRQQSRDRLPTADWRFSQDENDDAVEEVAKGASGRSGWIPVYVDYLYLSLTNSSAFSPTDTMPLSSRAKLLMGVQATAALFVTLLVIARAVSALGS